MYAAESATRPRGVRANIPFWMRNGSYTSSTVSASSPTLIASVDRPTGPPPSSIARSPSRRPLPDLADFAVDVRRTGSRSTCSSSSSSC